jgi:hypothetical protein
LQVGLMIFDLSGDMPSLLSWARKEAVAGLGSALARFF